MTVVQNSEYNERERALENDPVVQRMAADLRYDERERSQVAHEDGTTRHGFMVGANAAYRDMGGTYDGPLHCGAVANAVLRLTFDTTPASYSVYPAGSDLPFPDSCSPFPYSQQYAIEAINTQELGLRLRGIIAEAHRMPEHQIQVELMGNGADHMCAGRAQDPQGRELMAFQFRQE